MPSMHLFVSGDLCLSFLNKPFARIDCQYLFTLLDRLLLTAIGVCQIGHPIAQLPQDLQSKPLNLSAYAISRFAVPSVSHSLQLWMCPGFRVLRLIFASGSQHGSSDALKFA